MEVISKPELDKSLLRVPTHVKRVLRSGELGTYDVLELMGNTVNASADEVNRATDWVNENGEILRLNEIERAKNEGNYVPEDGSEYENNGRIQAEAKRVEDFNTFMQESNTAFNEQMAQERTDWNQQMQDQQNAWSQQTSQQAATFATNEGNRQSTFNLNEGNRKSTFETNEAHRISTFNSNETARQTNESARISAENTRVTAETARIEAENVRVNAENTRNQRYEAAEATRNATFNSKEALRDEAVANIIREDERVTKLEDDVTTLGSKTEQFREDYGLVQGYTDNGRFNTSGTRVCTTYINALYKDVLVVASGAFIRFAESFDENRSFVEHITINGNSVTLSKGYYYRLTLSKDAAGTASVTPSDILPFIYIGNDAITIPNIKTLNELTNYSRYLKVGYYDAGPNKWQSDNRRVSLLNVYAPVNKVRVLTKSPILIAGYNKYNLDGSHNTYESVSADNCVLDAGYYYSLVFKNDTNTELSVENVIPYVELDYGVLIPKVETLEKIYEINGHEYSLQDFDANKYYSGTEVGSTLSEGNQKDCYRIKIEVTEGQTFELTTRGGNGARAWYLLDDEQKIVDLSAASFSGSVTLKISNDVRYLVAQTNNGVISLKKNGLPNEVKKNSEDIDELKKQSALTKDSSFKGKSSFLFSELSRLKNGQDKIVNIGFIGDSWTQGTENIIGGVNQGNFEGYVKHLTKMLQDEYGFAGLGWLDFSRNNGAGQMFGCAEMYERWSYRFTGNVTGLDGDTTSIAPNCLGICCAHTIFGNGSTLTLNFNNDILDRFVIRFYKNAKFTIAVNDSEAVTVTANSTDGWQEREFGATGVNTTKVVITSLADNTIIFGMDCFLGTKGVRCHKVGNRSIRAAHYIAMNAEQWKQGISKLDLCWASCLLAINDVDGKTDESFIDTVINNISVLLNRLEEAYKNNDMTICDINMLGVEDIEDDRWVLLPKLAQREKEYAYSKGYGWTSTDECIGRTKAELAYKGDFSDKIHLNVFGAYSYAKHIYNALFVE